jgi:predicted metal-dependent peptidase
MSQARVKLTQEEEDFFRVILYHAVSDEQAQPYLRKAFYRLIPVAVEGSKTMSIDEHWRVYIDFEEMMRRGSSYATGILHHEIWHPLRQHHKLVETLDAAPAGYNQGVIANLAADLEINDDIAHLIPANAIKGQRSVFKQYPENGIFAPYYDKMLEDLDYLEKYFPSIKETSVAQQPQQQQGEGSPDEDQSGKDGDAQKQDSGDGSDGAEQPNNPPGSGDEEKSSESSDGSSEPSAEDSDSSDSDDSSSSSPSQPQKGEKNDQSQGDEQSSENSSQGAEAGEGGESSSSGDSSAPPPFPGQGSSQSQNPSQPGGAEPGKQTPPFPGSAQKPASPFLKALPEPQQAPSREPSQNQGESENGSDQDNNGGDIEESDYWNHPECGSSTGNPAEYELPPGEAPEMSESEEENLTRAVARDIQDWLKENPGVGSGQGKNSLGDWAEQRLKAKTIPWQQELRGVFLSAAATVRGKLLYVRNKPSRRQPVPEFMFPALKAPKPTIGIGIDVSGSNLGNLRVILDEIVKMMKSMNVQGRDVEAFAVDVAVSKTKTVSNPLKLLDDLPVGGGTRMKPGYMKLAEMGKDVSLLITDGWVDDYPEEQPKGKKRTKFITCIVMQERTKKNDSRVRKAKRIMGKWCKVIPIYVSEMKQSSS